MSNNVPTCQEFFVPVLKTLSDGETRLRTELIELVAANAKLTSVQRSETLSSGQKCYVNRIGWALTYLLNVKAISKPARAQFTITEVGRDLLEQHLDGITINDLINLEGFKDFKTRKRIKSTASPELEVSDPFERIDQGVLQINEEVSAELLERLHAQPPVFFEQVVVSLLVAMGYGGADARATITQLTNDYGIDGVIDQDVLGLSRIYIQAKRYAPSSQVGRPDVQSFVGALQGQNSNQGVFITTGSFSQGAKQYAQSVSTHVILIDGQRLTELMIRYKVGVTVKQIYEIVEVDENFFE